MNKHTKILLVGIAVYAATMLASCAAIAAPKEKSPEMQAIDAQLKSSREQTKKLVLLKKQQREIERANKAAAPKMPKPTSQRGPVDGELRV